MILKLSPDLKRTTSYAIPTKPESHREMAARYITDRFLPDKAIGVIDEAGAFRQLQAPSVEKGTGALSILKQ